MINSSFFTEVLTTTAISAADLLKKLSSLNHVIYLKNTHQPTIVFNAENYLLCKKNKTLFFQKNTFNQYIYHENPPKDFLKFSTISHQNTSFSGGYVGFISYDYAAQQHVQIEEKEQPSFFIGQFLNYLKYTNNAWHFYSHSPEGKEIFQYLQQCLVQKLPEKPFHLSKPITARWSKATYLRAFQHIQEYIKAGDCYQINLTQEFQGKAQGSLLETAKSLWQLTDAPYSGYIRVADFELLSCSPELFIDFEENLKIKTKPIKGTMPRYTDPDLDEQSKQTLKNSEKDMAENVMIVDLLRNDLSVYAEIGTVKTPKLFDIESFNQVHHMVSEITATLKPNTNPFEVLLAALPGGSITGAPKIRAMQIIEELEAAPRGAYCGSLGYFNFDGTGSWNILIRSIQKYQEDVSLWAGGGITIASDGDAEYQECFDKVNAILKVLNRYQ